MALSVGRQMTYEDKQKIESAAERFCKRYATQFRNLFPTEDESDMAWEDIADMYCEDEAMSSLRERKLWRQAFRRALGGYDSYGWGYVGYHVD